MPKHLTGGRIKTEAGVDVGLQSACRGVDFDVVGGLPPVHQNYGVNVALVQSGGKKK